MKLTKSLFTALLLIATLTTACEEPSKPIEPQLSVSPTSITFTAEGGSQTLTLSANYPWSAEVSEGGDWLGLNRLSGEAGEESKLTVTAWDNSSESSRSGIITFTCHEKNLRLEVLQEGIEVIPEPEIPVASKSNTYVINGVEHNFGTTAAMMVGENIALAATPDLNAGGVEDIMLTSSSYFYGAVSPLLVGKEFDIMSEEKLFTFISTLVGAALPDGLTPETLEGVKKGKALLNYVDNVATLSAGFVLADNTTIAVNIEATQSFTINQNTITRGDEEKPIRASFYMAEDGLTGLYLTTGGIDYFEELEIVTWYMYVLVDDSLLTGEEIDITSVKDKTLMLGLVDNLNYDNSWSISADDLQGATGTIKISQIGSQEGQYSIVMNISLGGTRFTASYEGEFTDYELAPEVNTNYFISDKNETTISSASIDTSSEVWTVTLDLANGKSVVATMPEKMCDGNMRGFSQSADLTVTYDGVTFSKANGYSGTLSILFDQQKSRLSTSFTNYSGCEFAYDGPVKTK